MREKKAKPAGNKGFWKIISGYIKGYEKNIIISVIFSVITGVTLSLQPLVIKYIVDDGIMSDLADDAKFKMVGIFCAVYVVLSFIRLAAFGVASYSTNTLMEGVLFNLRNAFFGKVQHLP